MHSSETVLNGLHLNAMPMARQTQDGSLQARKRSGKYAHLIIKGGVGHDLSHEAPQAFVETAGHRLIAGTSPLHRIQPH